MRNLPYFLSVILLLSACHAEVSVRDLKEQETNKSTVQPSEETEESSVEIPAHVESKYLVNNPTSLPEGYHVETEHLKQPLLIDFDGDGKKDAFRVLKNPSKSGMKYLFEFRIADSEKVYFYENEDKEYDLDGFEIFNKAEKGETFLNIMDLESNITLYEDVPQKERFALKTDAITVGYPESCGTSLFYIYQDKLHRQYLD